MESREIPRGNPVQGGHIICVVVVLQGQEDNKNLEKNDKKRSYTVKKGKRFSRRNREALTNEC